MKRTTIISLVALLMLSGCVTRKTFDALEKQHLTTVATLGDRDRQVGEMEKRITDLEGRIAALEESGLRLEKDKSALEAALSECAENRDRCVTDYAALNEEYARILKARAQLKESAEKMKKALAELEKRKAQVEARLGEFRQFIDRFRPLMDAGKLRVKMARGRMVVELASDVLFASGSATLGKSGNETIVEVARLLASIPDRAFQIEGHTDNVPIRSERFPSNWELAAARAVTVLKAMVESGMPADRVSAASFGEAQPARANDTKENKAVNRRIEIVVVPDLSGLPGYDELERMASP